MGLVKSKPVKQEVSRTVILPPRVIVLCVNYYLQPWSSGYGKETHVPKVVGSNLGTLYWMDILEKTFYLQNCFMFWGLSLRLDF